MKPHPLDIIGVVLVWLALLAVAYAERVDVPMLRRGVVKPYDGGTKEKWTDEELKRIEGMKP